MGNKNLEQIFWKDGKFVNKKGKIVKASPIGKPRIIYTKSVRGIHKYLKFEDLEANAFIKGELNSEEVEVGRIESYTNYSRAIQFYKI